MLEYEKKIFKVDHFPHLIGVVTTVVWRSKNSLCHSERSEESYTFDR